MIANAQCLPELNLDVGGHSMKTLLIICALFILMFIGGGCASSGYLTARCRDASDVFTVAVGVGVGAKIRVGPIAPGLIVCHDFAGLRAGTCFLGNNNPLESDVAAPFPITLRSWDNKMSFGHDVFSLQLFNQATERPQESFIVQRNKDVVIMNPLPCIALGKHACDYTQIEAVVGVGGSLRLGFNAGELMDFILGWTTLDIYHDDKIGIGGSSPLSTNEITR